MGGEKVCTTDGQVCASTGESCSADSDCCTNVCDEAANDGAGACENPGTCDPAGDLCIILNPDAALADGALEETCGASPFDADRAPANALLVIDKSGSMNKTPSGFASDKWTALAGALGSALTAVQDDLSVGVDLYPVGAACEVPGGEAITVDIGKGEGHVDAIATVLGDTTPDGSTPTAAALTRALSYYTGGAGADLEGDRYVVLATDGGPNCNDSLSCQADGCTANLENDNACGGNNCCDPSVGGDDGPLFCRDDDTTLDAVKALADAGIPTVVVGIPGSEAFASLLDQLAVAGGLPSGGDTDYYAVTADGSGAGGLADVLDRITQQLIRTCDLQLADMPPDLDKLNVEVDGEVIKQGAQDGWELDTSTTPPTVKIQGATCEAIKAEGAMEVEVTYGCPTETII